VIIRERLDTDLDRCERLAQTVHRLDGYPPHLPGRGAFDLRPFISTPGAIRAWVAETGSDIVGHVALHHSSSRAVMRLASTATRLPPEQFGVVARLFVSPSARRGGVGQSLLRTAGTRATNEGLSPILDVATQFEGAIHLYEMCGWVRAGMVTVRLSETVDLDEFVYVAPDEV
jgi:GNAT superfamily N-acetyltransferase